MRHSGDSRSVKDDAIPSVTFGKTLIERTMDCRAVEVGRSWHRDRGTVRSVARVRFDLVSLIRSPVESRRFVGQK